MLLTTAAFSQAIDKPVIKVEYDSVDVITERMLTSRLEQQKSMAKMYKQSPDSINRKEVAQSLVKERLLLQYAVSLNIEVDDYYIDSQIDKQKKMIEQQVGRQISNDEFASLVTQFGISLKELKENFKRVEMIQQLVNREKADFISDFPKPSDSDIEKLFRKMAAAGRLTSPTYVKISHLFVDTTGMKFEEMQKANQEMTKWQSDIEFGRKDFVEMVKNHSQDKDSVSSGGELGWTSMQDRKFMEIFGEDGALDIISLEKGAISKVLESPAGFHIVKILDRQDGGVPSIDDKLHPQVDDTYRDSIRKRLLSESAEQAFLVAMDNLFQELAQDAVITYYDKELE